MGKTSCFDAVIEFSHLLREDPLLVMLSLEEISLSASLCFYQDQPEAGQKDTFVQVYPSQTLSLKWKDNFCVKK